MTVMNEPSHALFFNGVSDGITIPRLNFNSDFSTLQVDGRVNSQSTPASLTSFTIEA